MNQNSESASPAHQRRVIVTVDTESYLPPTIELAVALALATESVLHGLFVEDQDLLSVAQLPFTQEVLLSGGKSRSLDDQQLLRSLDKFARQFRQALEVQAMQSALSCSHSVVRGRKHSMDLGEAGQAEFLVLAQPLRGRVRLPGTLRVLLVATPDSAMLSALEVILRKNPGTRTELLLLHDREEGAGALAPALVQLLAAHPQVVPVSLPADQLQPLLMTRSPRIDYVLASRQLPQGQLEQILRLATCPVIVAAAAA